MKKLIFSFFSSFFVLIFIWTIIGYSQFGSDLVNKHFDFKSTIESLTKIFSWSAPDFIDILERFRKAFTFDGSFSSDIFEFFKLMVVPFEVIFKILKMFVEVAIAVFEFIFKPKFI